ERAGGEADRRARPEGNPPRRCRREPPPRQLRRERRGRQGERRARSPAPRARARREGDGRRPRARGQGLEAANVTRRGLPLPAPDELLDLPLQTGGDEPAFLRGKTRARAR